MCLDDDRPERFSWSTPTLKNWRYWALAAHASATSAPHIDCAGLCTWLQIPVGAKLWLIGFLSKKHSVAEVMKASFGKTRSIQHERLEWVCIFLEAGDEL